MIAKSIYVIISKKNGPIFKVHLFLISISLEFPNVKKNLYRNLTRNLPLKSTDPGTLSPPFVNLKKVLTSLDKFT